MLTVFRLHLALATIKHSGNSDHISPQTHRKLDCGDNPARFSVLERFEGQMACLILG